MNYAIIIMSLPRSLHCNYDGQFEMKLLRSVDFREFLFAQQKQMRLFLNPCGSFVLLWSAPDGTE